MLPSAQLSFYYRAPASRQGPKASVSPETTAARIHSSIGGGGSEEEEPEEDGPEEEEEGEEEGEVQE